MLQCFTLFPYFLYTPRSLFLSWYWRELLVGTYIQHGLAGWLAVEVAWAVTLLLFGKVKGRTLKSLRRSRSLSPLGRIFSIVRLREKRQSKGQKRVFKGVERKWLKSFFFSWHERDDTIDYYARTYGTFTSMGESNKSPLIEKGVASGLFFSYV